jgi:hypothetical protein
VLRVARASPVRKASSSVVVATTAAFASYSTAPNHRYRYTPIILNKFHPMQTIRARQQMGSRLARTFRDKLRTLMFSALAIFFFETFRSIALAIILRPAFGSATRTRTNPSKAMLSG